MLHLELVASVPRTSCAHSLRTEDTDLDEAAECQLLKPGPAPSSLCSARFHRSPSFNSMGDSYHNTTDITYNYYSSHNRQSQGYLANNFIQFIYGLFSPKIISP